MSLVGSTFATYAKQMVVLPPIRRWFQRWEVYLTLISIVGMTHYLFVRTLLGPLTSDERYFAHTVWMLRQGLDQYTDFYSNHLPVFFWLTEIIPASQPDDLSFVWWLRACGGVCAIIYAALLFRLNPHRFWSLLPLLLVMLVLGRMLEIRSDTVGLLLVNGAWWFLIRPYRSSRILLAAALVGIATYFSARAGVMAVGFAVTCLAIVYRERDRRTFLALLAIVLCYVATIGIAYLAAPVTFELAVRFVFLDPLVLMPDVSLWQRVVGIDRSILVGLIVLGLAGGVTARSLPIIGAVLAQICLIVVDPSPFQYVYGWSAIPVIAGIGLLPAFIAPLVAATLTVALAGLSIAYTISRGHTPPTGSFYRLTYDTRISGIDRLPTQRLLSLMVSGERQQGLWNELAVREQVCHRIPGEVLSTFAAHPICLRDSRYEWVGLTWPSIATGQNTGNRSSFARIFQTDAPDLFVWQAPLTKQPLDAWVIDLLTDYEVGDGFAVRRGIASSPSHSQRLAHSRPRSGSKASR